MCACVHWLEVIINCFYPIPTFSFETKYLIYSEAYQLG